MAMDLEQLLGVRPNLFPPASRYYGVAAAALEMTDCYGNPRAVVYLKRRFVPPPERLALIQEHIVAQGDRLDNLAAAYYGDPELYWRLCDANEAMSPDALTETTGRRLRVTLPEGVPG